MRAVAAAALALLLGGCATLPRVASVSCGSAPRPPVTVSDDGRTASVDIDVLTYNVEGLPKLIRSGRTAPLAGIGAQLAALRARGEAPGIVLLQEVFSRAAVRAALSSGYPSLVRGPERTDPPPPPVVRRPLPGRPDPRRGEIGIKLASSGLLIASDYPVVAARARPFARGSCAGIDCLANKGVAFARIKIPGVPGTLAIFNTHMNSHASTRVSAARNLAAHNRQVAEAARFIETAARPGEPVIFGGDLNMRGLPERFEEFDRSRTLRLVHRWCLQRPRECDVRMSWDGDAPWLETQDLQLFRSGPAVTVRPIRVETMFDGGASGARLSDHAGLRVHYRLSWPVAATPASACPG